MSKLDLIADTPLSQEQLWNRWFFGSLDDADFVVMLVIFGALFLLLLSVAVLLAVTFVKRKKDIPERKAESYGSIHILPFLCSVIGSIIVIVGVLFLIYTVLMMNLLNPYFYQYLDYTLILSCAAIASILLLIALRFSPNAGKGFRTWNRICLVPALLTVGIGLFFCAFYWFTLIV